MDLDAALPTRRQAGIGFALVGVALAGAATVHASSLPAGGLAEGRDVPPVVVMVGSATPAHWVPWVRHRVAPVAQLRSTVSSTPVRASAPVAAPATVTALNLAPEHATSYSFTTENAPGDPVRWDACGTVHWTFNPAGSPTGGLAAVQSAVTRVEQVTGLHFAYDGTATDVPTGSYLSGQTEASGFKPLLIGWSTPSASSLLADQPASLVGMDQTIMVRPASGPTHIVSGVVALNADVAAATSGRNSWYTFALHELGHAMGLGHTTDATQIMAPTIPAGAADYGSGDLAGLTKVGGTC